MSSWTESYVGGSAEAEQEQTARLAIDIMRAQHKARKAAKAAAVDRAFHAKAVMATDRARIKFIDNLPEPFTIGFARPGASYEAIVRFSNAANHAAPDYKPDLRGIALRILVSDDEQHDLLATNFPVSHARNARQFVRFGHALAGGGLSRLFGLVRLVFTEGPFETERMLRNVSAGRKQVVRSVALETYWSRGAMRWGPHAVRFLIRPRADAPTAPNPPERDPEYLGKEAARRLRGGDIVLELCLQPYVDARKTPIEDTAVEWLERDSSPFPVATITVAGGAANAAVAEAAARAIDGLAFNPWNTTDEFRPLGNLNRARKAAYDASAAHRQSMRWHQDPPLRNRIFSAPARAFFRLVNRLEEWHRLPLHAGLLNLDMFRHALRHHNLIDTNMIEAPPEARPVPVAPSEEDRVSRTFDGRYNDLSAPLMGSAGQPFGRNLKPDFRPDLMDEPNPYTVSEVLLKREAFIPARSLNILAAAWIQFQVHDWVDHARHRIGTQDVRVKLPEGARWRNTPDGPEESEMRFAGNIASVETPDGLQRVFGNQVSHWWDGSEVYGAGAREAASLREGARLRLPEGYLPTDINGMDLTGFNQSWWLGLSALHTLFAREHNLLCDELHRHYPLWSDDRVYHTARLIVSALIAKIHTVEWTPAILATRAIDIALKNNWFGPPRNDWATKFGLWLIDAASTVGIPETMPDHHGAPYCLTEDFATVYRLHPLIPDDYVFHHHATGKAMGDPLTFDQIQGRTADDQMRARGLHNTLYSFGIAHPGAIVLHNYPDSLRGFEREGERIDLAVVDLVRTRRRGVPRYNDFRAGLHKPRIRRWEDLSDDPESVRRLREVYRTIDEVDTMVGLFAEPVPHGFGFSDTAFRIFILMASRRLQSDRFLTVDFRPEIYSPFGMDWIERNGFTSVILRHCPGLAAMVPRDASAFAPWRPVPIKAP